MSEVALKEAKILRAAKMFEAGRRQLWRERILGQYLRGEVSREQAIDRTGIDWVELAEQQHAAMKEDLAWGRSD